MKVDIYTRINAMNEQMEGLALSRAGSTSDSHALAMAVGIAHQVRTRGICDELHADIVETARRIQDTEPFLAAHLQLIAEDYTRALHMRQLLYSD